jgi:hypothetical protein
MLVGRDALPRFVGERSFRPLTNPSGEGMKRTAAFTLAHR